MFQNVSHDSAPGDARPPHKPLRILHIEDSAADQALARLSLLRGGLVCEIVAVDLLDDAAAALQSQAFDLILADYHLPGFTALDAWELVRRQPGHPPFVLLSGAIRSEEHTSELQSPCNLVCRLLL